MDRTNRNCFRASLFSPWFYRCRRRVTAGSIGVILALFACVAVTPLPHAQTEEPSTALISSRAVALNPETGKVYAVETSRNVVSVFDPQTESMSSVPVGAGPIPIPVNPATDKIYFANSEGRSVSLISATTHSQLSTLTVTPRHYFVSVNSATN